ncbi:ion transporter [Alkalilimnicola ehrlichii MLHE-1]|uniref:Ion transport protein n=1 Tax=Alkalilimnicola ehrlichii (strain ATCC BAA-1101 / DSM 17681 / MLHE-1) TaxID=187272 RepID=Q0ABW0_ALKEH|nr:ion transporter [Alkalilimnicola ehrlichii]ABI55677.1 Ion transport protein [Alkalilimnicola ehrlichii MLHE-1]
MSERQPDLVGHKVQHPEDETLRGRLAWFIDRPGTQYFIVGLILVNAITLGLMTSPEVTAYLQPWLGWVNTFIIAAFVVEISLRIIADGPRFVRSGWNLFDFSVVAISLVPDSGAFSVLRALRILKVLRLFSMVPRLRRIVEALLRAIPGIAWIALLLLVIFYVFAVMGTKLFAQSFPEWFGTLGASMYTLFQVMTLESWSMGIARPVIEAYPWAWIYFVSFILVSSFTVLNLFIGIIIESMQSAHWEAEDAKRIEQEQRAHDERLEMLQLIRDLSSKVDRLERRSGKR